MASLAASSDDEARKNRIISHMNRDHTRELSHYLRHYNGLSPRQASKASLRDISLDTMHVRAAGLNHAVPFLPPLSSWDELRPRLAEMDVKARDALGVSDVYISQYRAPEGIDVLLFGSVTFYLFCLASLPWVQPGTRLWNIAATLFPGGALWYRWTVQMLVLPVLGIHLTEAVLFDKRRMQRHGVERWSSLWWTWEGSVMIEGASAWWRIDRMIKEKRRHMQGKKEL